MAEFEQYERMLKKELNKNKRIEKEKESSKMKMNRLLNKSVEL